MNHGALLAISTIFLSQEDKRGMRPHPSNLCTGFQRTVEDYGLSDINLEGYRFTWSRSRGTLNMVEEQLDRAMADLSWLELFPNVALTNILASHSDHNPILLQCHPVNRKEYKHMFRFENQWLLEEDLAVTVANGWNCGTSTELGDIIEGYADELQRWSRRKRSHFKEEVKDCEEEMDFYRRSNEPNSVEKLLTAERKHNQFLVKEEVYWK